MKSQPGVNNIENETNQSFNSLEEKTIFITKTKSQSKNSIKAFLPQIIGFIYGIAAVFLIGTLIINVLISKITFVSPLNSNFSVFSMLNNTQRESDYRVYGFLPYWKLNEIKYIQTHRLTDIAYFALHINSDGTIRRLDENGNLEPGYNNWKNNENLKTLISEAQKNNVNFALTVISHEDDVSDAFLDCRTCWPTLIKEISQELEYAGIKDINLDFEYVGYPEKEKAEKYTEFVALINKELDTKYGDSTVTVSTFADSGVKNRITDPKELVKVADLLFVMAYDFHYPNSEFAGPIAPITREENYTSYDIRTMLNDYLKNIPPNKLVLGVAYYGYNWVVYSDQPYAERIPGNDYIGYSISQTYETIMDSLVEKRPKVNWDEKAQAPYFSYVSPYSGVNRLVYFENQDSLKLKYDLVKTYNLGGVGIWALGYDGGYQDLWNLLGREFN